MSEPSHADDTAPRMALVAAVERIGDRWSLLTIDALATGPQRFGELSGRLGGIAPNVLTKRLRQLEADGIVTSAAYSQRPVRLAYELTDSGRDLATAIDLLAGWGARHHSRRGGASAEDSRDPIHPLCGSTLEIRLWCPTCGDLIAEADSSHDYHL